MGRTGIYACGESVSRCNSLESVVLFSWKQEAPTSIGGGTFTTVELYFTILIDKKEALKQLKYEKPNWQVCFRTEKSLNYLRYIGSERL